MTIEQSEENLTFLSTLRERSSIVFTIGLALSIASFVENLHMGKDVIAYVVAEISKIDGWADAVRALAAIVHGALEWWRGVMHDFVSLLPFQLPAWVHEPLSVLLFGLSRMWSSRHYSRTLDSDGQRRFAFPVRRPRHARALLERAQQVELIAIRMFQGPLTYVAALVTLYLTDEFLYQYQQVAQQVPIEQVLSFVTVLSAFLAIYIYARMRMNNRLQRLFAKLEADVS